MDGAIAHALEQLGLTQVEAKVYLALLENGSQQAGAITKLSGIHRRTVYDAIARLIEKGLISYIKSGKVKAYQAAHPERLHELLKEQEQGLVRHMPQLEELYERRPGRHETVFYKGKKGLKALFDDQLKLENGTIHLQGATPAAMEALQFYFPQFDRQRMRRHIRVHLLFHQQPPAYVKKIPLAEARMLKMAQQDVVTCIYADTVSIISFANPFGILIREQAIADQYKNYFSLLWKQARQIRHSNDA